jgi:hypothetical protein
MPVTWRNNGEPVDGEYVAEISFTDGRQKQVFRGASYKDVADRLLQAQEHASDAINQLKQGRTPDPATPRRRAQPKPMTAGERMKVASDITDPAKADGAITRVVESVIGPVESIREAVNKLDDDDEAREGEAAAQSFSAATPDWYPSDHNKGVLVKFMQTKGYAPTSSKNFSIAFDELREAGLLQSRPADPPPNGQEDEPPPERIASQPVSRPRGTLVTGVRASDTSGTGPRAPRPKYTREDIEKMGTATYKQKLQSEPGFEALVEQLYKR